MSSAGASVAMGRVLLICNDAAIIEHLTESMHQLAIATEVCMHAEMALGLMNLKKFEGVIVDFGLNKAQRSEPCLRSRARPFASRLKPRSAGMTIRGAAACVPC